jgi:hypothetical protein
MLLINKNKKMMMDNIQKPITALLQSTGSCAS